MARWINNKTRLAIYLRDGLACVYCGSSIEDGHQLSLDHLKPRSKGGCNSPKNLVTCCRKCNSSRGNRPVKVFAEKVAEYLGHNVQADQILKNIAACRKRKLDRKESQEIMDRRGSAFKSIMSLSL